MYEIIQVRDRMKNTILLKEDKSLSNHIKNHIQNNIGIS